MNGAAGAEKVDEIRQDLKQIEQRIAVANRSLTEKRNQEKSLSHDLQSVEKKQAALQQRIDTQKQRLKLLKDEITKGERDVADQRKAVQGLKKQINERLAALYKGGELGLLRAVFGAETPLRMGEDYDYLGRIVRRDRELLNDYRHRLHALNAGLTRLSALRKDQEQLVAESRCDQDTLEQAARLKKRLLGQTRKDQGKLAEEVAALKERATRLSRLVRKLESAEAKQSSKGPAAALSSSPFGRQKGRLPWPATGKVEVGFGTGKHPKLGTLYESNGIEIRAAQNRPIAAVGGGKVVFANPFQGYGNLLIIDHGDNYFTLYAQASRLTKKVDERVRQGETVAFSGADTVYFEIRHRGVPLDPQAWLAPR